MESGCTESSESSEFSYSPDNTVEVMTEEMLCQQEDNSDNAGHETMNAGPFASAERAESDDSDVVREL